MSMYLETTEPRMLLPLIMFKSHINSIIWLAIEMVIIFSVCSLDSGQCAEIGIGSLMVKSLNHDPLCLSES